MDPKKPFELGRFQTSRPLFMAPQAATFAWLAEAYDRAMAITKNAGCDESHVTKSFRDRLLRFGCKPGQIGHRGFDTINVLDHNFDGSGIFTFNRDSVDPQIRGRMNLLGERSAFFAKRSFDVLQDLYPANTEAPAHIIHVSCTGYNSPSAAQRLVNLNAWHENTAVTHAYHMGCYASMPAVRVAKGTFIDKLSSTAPGHTDVVHTEICSLHLNPTDPAPDQMVINSLFADGHIKYSVAPAGSLADGFRILTIRERILRNSTEDMTWVPHEWGFKMGLSRDVPRRISENIRSFLIDLAHHAQCDLNHLLRDAIFAIHPGGPRIISSLQENLELQDHQTAASKQILFERGNMSSATLPHVWQHIAAGNPESGQKIVSLAFGPGLTLFGTVFEVI